jgi:hypothetical protein
LNEAAGESLAASNVQVGIAKGRPVEPQRVEWRAVPALVEPDTQAMQPTDELGAVHLSL